MKTNKPMNDAFEKRKATFKKTLEQAIEYKYITIDAHISIDGIAAMFIGDLWKMEQEEKKRKDIGIMLDIMDKYYPQLFKELIEQKKL